MNPVPPHHFSQRIANHPRIAVWPHKKGSSSSAEPLALAVVDQLLVSKQVVPDVLKLLEKSGKGALPGGPYQAGVIATVFQGLAIKPHIITDDEDVRIVKIAKAPKLPLEVSGRPLIFEVAAAVRQGLVKAGVHPKLVNRQVSPNHVLVPAPANVGCPFGAPRSSGSATLNPSTNGESPTVAVIDSGYQDWWTSSVTDQWGHTWGPWGSNPLENDCSLTLHQAQYLKGNLPLGAMLAVIASPANAANWFNTSGFWQAGTPDLPSTVQPMMLDALAGHANFVAGVIAQRCNFPTIDVWNLNGNFVIGSDDFPCEASVCRALINSQIGNATQVANVGFAFPLQAGSSAPLSVLWDTTFKHLGQTTVVAPAGNEDETALHFPAALNPNTGSTGPTLIAPALSPSLYPGSNVFANVRGVTSLADSSGAGSTFANHGGWVNCSAVGENVLSTFIPVSNVTCEDDLPTATGGPPPVKTFPGGLAFWQGSSFAAPKVAGALAAQLALGMDPLHAWNNVKAMAQPPAADPNFGFKLPTL